MAHALSDDEAGRQILGIFIRNKVQASGTLRRIHFFDVRDGDFQRGINSAVANVQSASDHLGVAQGFYGSVQNRIQDASNFGQSYDLQLKTQLSQKVDADITAAAMELTQGTVQLQAAFQMQAKMPRTTLFDFLA